MLFGLGFSRLTHLSSAPPPQESLVAVEREPEQVTVKEEIEATLSRLLPWGVSILFHVALVVLAIVLVVMAPLEDEKEPPVIPTVSFHDRPVIELTIRTDPDKPELEKKETPADRSETIDPDDLWNERSLDTPIMETGLLGGAWGGGLPDGLFEVTHGESTIFGQPSGDLGEARKIVYVIDASGSLIDTLPFVIDQLKIAIMQLKDHQSFTVIFYQGDKTIEAQPAGLKHADTATKRKVAMWADPRSGQIVPAGRSHPIPAIKQALRYQPDLILLLSDNITGSGQYEVNQANLVEQITRVNTRKTKINTIQFLYPDPLAKIGMQPTLELISLETGGTYKFYDGRELGIQ